MEDIYARLNLWDEREREDLMRRWLWGAECNAPPLERCCDMNEMHIIGILVCLGEHACPVPLYHEALNKESAGGEGPDIIFLHPDTPIKCLSLRETLDQLECLQLHWGPTIAECGYEHAARILRAMMSRVGEIAHHAYPAEGQVLDDPQHTTLLPGSDGLGVISRKSLRQAICVLLALWRVHQIVSQAKDVPETSQAEVNAVVNALRQHHTEASMDCFNELQQMVYLAPGQRLVYRTNFSGMYNDVSQVVYFHNLRFCRKPQMSIERIPESPMHMVPLIMQLAPEITLVYDDDSKIPGLTVGRMAVSAEESCSRSKGKGGTADEITIMTRNMMMAQRRQYEEQKRQRQQKEEEASEEEEADECAEPSSFSYDAADAREEVTAWRWLVCCGAFFLLEVRYKIAASSQETAPERYIWAHERLAPLVAYYLRKTKQSIGASDAGEEGESQAPAENGHAGEEGKVLGPKSGPRLPPHMRTPFSHVQLMETSFL